MPAKSVSQQKYFGMLRAIQKGDMKAPNKEMTQKAKDISKKDVKDFASTKTKGLPNKVSSDLALETIKAHIQKGKFDTTNKAEKALENVEAVKNNLGIKRGFILRAAEYGVTQKVASSLFEKVIYKNN